MNNTRDIELLKSFGSRIRELRKLRNLSQEELSHQANIQLSQVGRIERGENNLTLSTMKVLADALGVSLSELFQFDL